MTKEQQKLVEENHGLIYSFLAKHNLPIEEYYDLAAIGLCKASITYQNETTFSTYAYKCMFNEVMQDKRKEKASRRIPQNQIISYEAELDTCNDETVSYLNFIPSNEDVESNSLSKIMFEEYSKDLSDRDKQVLSLFSAGYKQREIGKIIGCSQTIVSRIKRKLENYLGN